MDRSQWEYKRPKDGYPILRAKVDGEVQHLINFSDLHVGHPNCRVDLIKRGVEWAKEHDALCICGGDWIENSSKASVGGGWVEQIMPPQKQVDYVCSLFEPIKDQFLGGIAGNHELRTWNVTGMDPMQTICEKLEMPYFGFELYAIISRRTEHGGRAHTVYATHSKSGHKSSGLAVNKMQRDWSFVIADVKMKSHDHQLDYDTNPVVMFDSPNLAVRQRLQHLVLTGSALERHNSYAAQAPHSPTRLGFMPIILNMEKRELDAPRTHWGVRPIYELAEG
jgi:hypothetical protein